MKTKPADHHRVAFIQGHVAQSNATDRVTPENPYILTSNSSDAFLLGCYAASRGIPTNAELHKSRGFTWRMNGQVYKVDGKIISIA